MATSKNLERACAIVLIVSLLASAGLVYVKANGGESTGQTMGYESRLFDTSRVHTIDIVMDDWDGFIENCESEEYSACAVVIDGESYKNVAIRAKGNTSLSSVRSLGSSRYSFKVEFDHYDDTKTYHGLDKLNLNNLIFDNTMMKDYLTYRMMAEFGVDAPLCSFVYITVNGEDFGLYLAVEGVEDAFFGEVAAFPDMIEHTGEHARRAAGRGCHDYAARGVLLADGQSVGEGQSAALEVVAVAFGLDVVLGGLAAQVERAGEASLLGETVGDRLLHRLPDAVEIFPDCRAFAFFNVFPKIAACLLAVGHYLAERVFSVDVGGFGFVGVAFDFYGASADAVDGHLQRLASVGCEACECHGVGVVG